MSGIQCRLNTLIPDTAPAIPSTPRRALPIRILAFATLAIFSAGLGFTMAAAPALQTANEILNPPTDEETLSLFNPVPGEQAHEINEHILSHPLTLQLNADDRFFASRPHLKIPPSLRTHNFTGGVLSGEDKIPVPPLIFATRDGSELISIQCK
jgi:hypothetical protein